MSSLGKPSSDDDAIWVPLVRDDNSEILEVQVIIILNLYKLLLHIISIYIYDTPSG